MGGSSELVTFYVAERLAADVILGCDFCDRHIEAIRPRKRLVEMDDGSTVPIVRRPDKRKEGSIPLPEEQVYVPAKERVSNKVVVHSEKRLQPNTQTWVEVTTDTHGLIQVEPLGKLFTTNSVWLGMELPMRNPGYPSRSS